MLIRTKRFFLRPLTVDDVTETYASWLRNEISARYIVSASSQQDIASIKDYVATRLHKDEVLFLGIFVLETGIHIGNIKFEPLDDKAGTTFMGILIGDSNWRGNGVAPEVLDACADWLYINRGISQILLGVDLDNAAAIRAYEKAGFKPTQKLDKSNGISTIMMVRRHYSVGNNGSS